MVPCCGGFSAPALPAGPVLHLRHIIIDPVQPSPEQGIQLNLTNSDAVAELMCNPVDVHQLATMPKSAERAICPGPNVYVPGSPESCMVVPVEQACQPHADHLPDLAFI